MPINFCMRFITSVPRISTHQSTFWITVQYLPNAVENLQYNSVPLNFFVAF